MAKKGTITKLGVVRYLHTIFSCVHPDGNLSETLYDWFKRKQNVLISGKNIRTVNGVSLLGKGNIVIGDGLAELELPDGDNGDEPDVDIPDSTPLSFGNLVNVDPDVDIEAEEGKTYLLKYDGGKYGITECTVQEGGNIEINPVNDDIFVVKNGLVCIKYNE